MYSEIVIDEMINFLKKELDQINKSLTGDISYFQGWLLGRKSEIEFVLETITIGKTNEK